ncbi:unnamed protein product [Knipowitschia caucasica]
MNQPFVLKVVLLDNTSQRLILSNGLPDVVEELVAEVKRQCGLTSNIRLQFMDPLFENEFMNLTNTNELQNRGTIKVINLSQDSSSDSLPLSEPSISTPTDDTTSFSSVDTDIVSSPDPDPQGSKLYWPSKFIVPEFSYDSEIKLELANAEYRKNGETLIPDVKLKSNILEKLIQQIVRYRVYVSDKQFNSVGEALMSKHPCLSERGSISGYEGWKTSLKNKLAHYRTELRRLGCPEVVVNAMANKPKGSSPALGIKKPKRSEVNYCPPFPIGETENSLEKIRVELQADIKKRNGKDIVRSKMDKTFSYRRYEVVRDAPLVQDFKERWPGLFDVYEINAEFKRLTTIPLQSRFLSQLDILSNKLLALFKKRGGQIGKKLQELMKSMTDEFSDEAVDAGRECILKALCVYLNEDPDILIKEHVGNNEADFEDYTENTTVGIFTAKQHAAQSKPDDIGIILEGQIVIQELDNVPLAYALLFGLLYALNMDYPPQQRYFFEVVQKVIMELDGGTLSRKAQVLKNRLLE